MVGLFVVKRIYIYQYIQRIYICSTYEYTGNVQRTHVHSVHVLNVHMFNVHMFNVDISRRAGVTYVSPSDLPPVDESCFQAPYYVVTVFAIATALYSLMCVALTTETTTLFRLLPFFAVRQEIRLEPRHAFIVTVATPQHKRRHVTVAVSLRNST